MTEISSSSLPDSSSTSNLYLPNLNERVVFQEVFNHQLPTIDFEADTFRQPQEFEFTLAPEDIY